MSEVEFKRTVGRGMAWVGLAASAVALFDMVALALILKFWVTTKEFGTVSVVVTALAALQFAAELGLPAAIVQRADADDDRLSTVYWIGHLAGIALYGIVWLIAPWVAGVYGEPILTPLFRVVALVLVIRPFYTTHTALSRRQFQFQEMSSLRIAANSIEFATKLGAAIGGAGVWCFALGPVVRELVYAIGMPRVCPWRPRRVFRLRLAIADFRFGMRSTASELLYQLYANVDYQVVAYYFGTASVGLYRAAKELVLEPVRFVSSVVTTVAFPTFARLRGNRAAINEQYIAFTRQNLVVVLLLVGVACVSADDVLGVILGPDYVAAAGAARILAIVGILRALSHLGPPLLDGLGRPDLSLRYHVTAAVILGTLFVAFAAAGASFFAVSVAWAVGYPVAFAVLLSMVFLQLEMKVGAYARQIGRLVGWVALAAAAGLIARIALDDLAPAARLALVAAIVIGTGGALLARFEGFSPRAIVRSLRR